MPESTGRFKWVGGLSLAALIGVIVILILMVIRSVAMIVIKASDMQSWTDIAQPALNLLWQVAALVFAWILYGLIRMVLSAEYSVSGIAWRISRIETLLTDQAETSRKLVDLASLSDRAKSFIFRDREIQALQEAVHHDILKQDYKAAEALIETLDTQLGCEKESARLREILESSRKGTLDEKIDKAVQRIQATIKLHDWSRALREAKRLIEFFPGRENLLALPGRIESARAAHKHSLLEAYDKSVGKKDIDGGVALLRELDGYLTPPEAAALEESARGVFKAKLHKLGMEFAIAVTDKQWVKAARIGDQITNEYPNTRMAHEVQEKIGMLHARADAQREGESS